MDFSHIKLSSNDQLSPDQIYDHFLNELIRHGCTYGLFGNGWALSVTEQGAYALALWHDPQLASQMSKGCWDQYLIQKLKISVLVDEIIPYLRKSHYLLSINLNDAGQHIQIFPERFLLDLKNKLYKVYMNQPEIHKSLGLPNPRKIRLHGSVKAHFKYFVG